MPSPSRKRSPNSLCSRAWPAATSAGSLRQTLRIPVATGIVLVRSRNGRVWSSVGLVPTHNAPKPRDSISAASPVPSRWGSQIPNRPSSMSWRFAGRGWDMVPSLAPRARLTLLIVALLVLVVPASADAALKARGSTGQAYVLGAKKGKRIQLLDKQGDVIAAGRTDRFGSKIFYEQRPGGGYRVKQGRKLSKPFRVLRAGANPKPAFYKRQKLKQGLNYVKVRDGVEIAMTVRLPAGKTLADGPFPTLIEYSGYQVAAPKDLLSALAGSLSGQPDALSDPLLPSTSTAVGSVLGPLLGFASVSVQMRGSGCSGGAFDLFGLPTTYDGYDAVETVAAQDWVKGGKVGLAGISFSGITQLFTAGTRPPHLAAIAPMSVNDDLYTATGFPGGIRNSGFAASWIAERERDARPAPAGGQPYAKVLVGQGDVHCRANQRLRLQTRDL